MSDLKSVRLMELCVEQEIDLRSKQAAYEALAARYDDALKRINDLEAELEFLRNELARKQ